MKKATTSAKAGKVRIFFSESEKKAAAKKAPSTNVARKRPGSAGSVRSMGSSGSKTVITTAEVIASSKDHPKRREVKELLTSFDKGWVSFDKFASILHKLVF